MPVYVSRGFFFFKKKDFSFLVFRKNETFCYSNCTEKPLQIERSVATGEQAIFNSSLLLEKRLD